jgi:hypothetical protein
MIQVLLIADLFVANTIWRGTGSLWAGSRIVARLAADHASVRSVAGILLVRGGDEAVPLVHHAIQRKVNLPHTLVVAGTLGAESLRSELEKFRTDENPAVAAAAEEGLRRLHARRSSGRNSGH